MLEVIFYKENGETKVKGIIIDNLGNKKVANISTQQALKIIAEAKEKENIDQLISKLNYSSNDMTFLCDGAKIRLQNKSDFLHDDNFKFIFDYIKRKNYKISRVNNIKKGVITVLSVGLIITTGVVVKNTLPEKKEQVFEDVQITYDIPKYEDNNEETTIKTEDIKSENEITINPDLFGTAKKEETSSYTVQTPTSNETISKEEVTKVETTTKKLTSETFTNALEEVTTKEAEEKKDDDAILYIQGDEPYSKGGAKAGSKIYLDNIDVGTLSDSDKATYVRENYGSIIRKYCNMYNLDYDIMCAVATQERGVHSTRTDSDGAIGLMQIQVSVWSNPKDYFIAYNYSTGEDEKIYPGTMNLGNLDTNIKVACAIMRKHLDDNMQNQMIALQGYNMGEGSIASIIRNYDYECGKSIEEIKMNPSDIGWIRYASNYRGDPNYISNVMRYYNGNKYLTSSKVR